MEVIFRWFIWLGYDCLIIVTVLRSTIDVFQIKKIKNKKVLDNEIFDLFFVHKVHMKKAVMVL